MADATAPDTAAPDAPAPAGPHRPARLLTVAGSDSGGGAGIQADLKTFAAHAAYGMSALTAVTAQNTLAVTAVHPLPAEMVAAQIDAVFDDLGVDGVKIGMLAEAAIVETVAERLAHHGAGAAGGHRIPVVLDPVMVAKSGDPLLADEAVSALVGKLLPLATLVTPNLPEARRILDLSPDGGSGGESTSEEERRGWARRIAEAGPAVLVKGGHGEGDEVVDLLFAEGSFHRFAAPRIDTRATHGTGCTLSSAIAARLACGENLASAVEGAIAYLRRAMETAPGLGEGHGPVNHLTPPA